MRTNLATTLGLGLGLLMAGPGWSAVYKGGTDTTYSWRSVNIEGCQKAGKPIVLYAYDSDLKTSNNFAEYIETKVFTDAKVKDAFKDFTMVKVAKSSTGWPAALLSQADKGSALFLMTCDGSVVGAWSRSTPQRPTADQVVAAAVQAAAGNPAALERLKKAPPPPKPDAKQGGANVAAANDPGEKKPDPLGAIPGLDHDAKKDDKKSGEKKADKKKNTDDE